MVTHKSVEQHAGEWSSDGHNEPDYRGFRISVVKEKQNGVAYVYLKDEGETISCAYIDIDDYDYHLGGIHWLKETVWNGVTHLTKRTKYNLDIEDMIHYECLLNSMESMVWLDESEFGEH